MGLSDLFWLWGNGYQEWAETQAVSMQARQVFGGGFLPDDKAGFGR